MSESANTPWLVEPATFAQTTFDYLVIGGGTAGLTLASRLAENHLQSVGVIEAGSDHRGNPMVELPENWGPLHKDPKYSWNFATTPQAHAQGRTIPLPSGKALGGSSAINLLAYMRASKSDYDNWEALGNKGWNWESLVPYFQKAETFSPPNPEAVFPGTKTDANSPEKYHGTEGPLHIRYNETYDPLIPYGVQAMNSLGIATNHEPNLGDATGIFNTATTVDRDTKKRSYSANTYLAQERKNNLSVVTEAQVTRIIFSPPAQGQADITATGVEFVHNGKLFTCNAAKEVILAAGTYQTPQLLELSGIGDAKRLSEYHIPCLVDLPQVGENYQDHLGVISAFGLTSQPSELDEAARDRTLAAFSFFPLKKIVPEETLAEMVNQLDKDFTANPSTPLQKAQFALQRKSIDTNIGTAEILFVGAGPKTHGQSYLAIFAAMQHPYSRGHVHIQSGDPLANPKIDGHFLESPFDLAVLNKITRFIRKLAATEPLSPFVSGPALPPSTTETDEEYNEFVRQNFQTVYHPVGTAAMAPREIGGVVDISLRVYGTRNLRVVDASIIPLHVATHTQATVYAIAEKAADIIKNGT